MADGPAPAHMTRRAACPHPFPRVAPPSLRDVCPRTRRRAHARPGAQTTAGVSIRHIRVRPAARPSSAFVCPRHRLRLSVPPSAPCRLPRCSCAPRQSCTPSSGRTTLLRPTRDMTFARAACGHTPCVLPACRHHRSEVRICRSSAAPQVPRCRCWRVQRRVWAVAGAHGAAAGTAHAGREGKGVCGRQICHASTARLIRHCTQPKTAFNTGPTTGRS